MKTLTLARPQPPNTDPIVYKYIAAIRSDIDLAISRSYATRLQKGVSTELTIKMHHARPDRLLVKMREEQSIERYIDTPSVIDADISPLESDNLTLNLNRCVDALQRNILPVALKLLQSGQVTSASLDVTLRFAKGRLRSHTLRIDAPD